MRGRALGEKEVQFSSFNGRGPVPLASAPSSPSASLVCPAAYARLAGPRFAGGVLPPGAEAGYVSRGLAHSAAPPEEVGPEEGPAGEDPQAHSQPGELRAEPRCGAAWASARRSDGGGLLVVGLEELLPEKPKPAALQLRERDAALGAGALHSLGVADLH